MTNLAGAEAPTASGKPAPLRALSPEALTLELRGIVKHWQRRPVLEGVDFTVEPGTATWLGGSNGAGKTTLLRIATGAIMPERGSVSLGGLNPERDRREYARRIAYLAAGDRNLYARLSVRRHLDLWGCLALLDKAARGKRPSPLRSSASSSRSSRTGVLTGSRSVSASAYGLLGRSSTAR